MIFLTSLSSREKVRKDMDIHFIMQIKIRHRSSLISFCTTYALQKIPFFVNADTIHIVQNTATAALSTPIR